MYKNKDFRFKLILPCKIEYYKPYVYTSINCLPYGMGIITAFLRKHGYYVEQEDLSVRFNHYNFAFFPFIFKNIDFDIIINRDEIHMFLKTGERRGKLSLFIDKILDSISIQGFDAIGFSIFSIFHFIFALAFSKRIKQITNTPIIFGGPFIRLYGQLYTHVFNYVDYMIVGDGGVPLLRLIEYMHNQIAISEVPNLIYRDNGKLIVNPRQHYPIEDIPMPDFDALSMKLYRNWSPKGSYISFPYQISRGCTNRCSFCANIAVNDKLEFKSYEKVLSELSQIKERYNNITFHFCDDAINNSYEYLEGLCDLFINNKLNINWSVYAKVGNLDKYILRKMKEAGCQWLLFGIESGSNRILKIMNKGCTSEEASQSLKDAHEAGIINILCLIAGYPHETKQDINKTIDFIRKNKKYISYAQAYEFRLEYGSAIYCNPERYGVDNLIPYLSRYRFAFDESEGLKWERKHKQQEESQKQIIKAIHKNIGFKVFISHLFTLFGLVIDKIKKLCHLIKILPFVFIIKGILSSYLDLAVFKK